MGGIIVKDFRPFLFQALEYGKKNHLFDVKFLKELLAEGVEMTLGFAKKYYRITVEEELKLSAYSVIGVISLALTEESGGNVSKAASLLHQNRLVKLFRLGWAKVAKLAELEYKAKERVHSKEEAERSISKLLSFFGLKEFEEKVVFLENWKNERDFDLWLVKKYYKRKDELVDQGKPQRINTLFASLLLKDIPFAPISTSQLKEIYQMLNSHELESLKQYVKNRLEMLQKDIPVEWLENWEKDANNFLDDTLFLVKAEIKDFGAGYFFDRAVETWFIDVDPNELDKIVYNEFRNSIKGKTKVQILQMLKKMSENSQTIDNPEKLAIVDELFEREEKITPGEYNLIIEHVPQEMCAGKILRQQEKKRRQNVSRRKIAGVLDKINLKKEKK